MPSSSSRLKEMEPPWIKDRRVYEQKKHRRQQRRGFRKSDSSVGSYSSNSYSPAPKKVNKIKNLFQTPPPKEFDSTYPFDTPTTQPTSTPRSRNDFSPSDNDEMDSLNDFLGSPMKHQRRESDTSTLSEHAIEAARNLKLSFHKKGRSLRGDDSSTITSNTSNNNTTRQFSNKSFLPATILEEEEKKFESSQSPMQPRKIHRPSGPVDLDATIASSQVSTLGEPQRPSEQNLALHDICDEAELTGDETWRKAVFLLSVEPYLALSVDPDSQMTALHVCSLGSQPPPIWMTRALLYTNEEQVQQIDSGGRLPLHLLAATSANLEMMQLLVEEYPPSVSHQDHRGFTPLQLMLKNDQIALTIQHLRILLGQTVKSNNEDDEQLKSQYISWRKGQHLEQTLNDLELMKRHKQLQKHEVQFPGYPDDVRSCLKKISQWKHRQITKGNLFHNSILMDNKDYSNPASIPTPTGKLFPLHLLVRRKPNPIPQNLNNRLPPALSRDLVRILVAAYPSALSKRDAHSRTPLMTAMLQTDFLPSLEVVELLLGIGTPGYYHQHESPAALHVGDTFQLPLHVAAEEMNSNFEMLSRIYEAYPQALLAQDIRGRTPLMLALRNYRSVPIDQPTLELLFDEKVSQIRDHDGKIPLDLVLKYPKCLQKLDESIVVQAFLDSSIRKPRNWIEEELLLKKLRNLPPWLRRHACAAQYVQEALMEKVASPFLTFWILLNGLILIGLLVMLRILLESAERDVLLTTVYVLASLVLANQVVYWMAAMLVGEFYSQCATNPWRWIDVAAGYLAIATANVIAEDVATLQNVTGTFGGFSPAREDPLASWLGTCATALIWLSLVGYAVQWWCSMAVFMGSAAQLLVTLFWPLVIAAMAIVGMSQVLYTIGDCSFSPEKEACSLSDAYTTIYWIILGQPVVGDYHEEESNLSNSMIALLVTFSLIWIWWIVSVIAMTVSEAHQLDRHQIALKWYWEPKIPITILSRGKSDTQQKLPGSAPPMTRSIRDSMERIWQILVFSIKGSKADALHPQNGRDNKYWYSCCMRPRMIYFTRVLAIFVLPIWFLLGVVTLGLLWPTQIRRWLFSTKIVGSIDRNKKQEALEERLTAAKVSNLKSDLLSLQSMTAEQGRLAQNDIQEIKEILYLAMEKK
jgi:ankyrin repeat protein